MDAALGDLVRMRESLSNWGRWGADDERGTVNLITPALQREATRLVQTGVSVSMARTIAGPSRDPHRPYTHVIYNTTHGRADFIGMSFHGYEFTHIDCFCHIFVDGVSYNGMTEAEISSIGSQKCAVTAFRSGICGRGVLLDIPRLERSGGSGRKITPADLEAAEKNQDVEVRQGDIVFVRAGQRDPAGHDDDDAASAEHALAGCSPWILPWLHERGVAVLGSDGISDAMPSGVDGWPAPIHQIALPLMGLPLIDNSELDELSAACQSLGRWEFFVRLDPLPLSGATGSPLNPVAMF
jgi:kynurenine formamidase